MNSQYDFVKRMSRLYNLLQDSQSRSLFWDRLKLDVHPGINYVIDLFADGLSLSDVQRTEQEKIQENLKTLYGQGKQVLLYGAGVCGRAIAKWLHNDGIPFYGFCDRKASEIVNSNVYLEPVRSPEYLLEHQDICYVIISTTDYYEEIKRFLLKHHFPSEHILPFLRSDSIDKNKRQYFEFPELFRSGTAFVDGGCFDSADSIYFARWCRGEYSKIFAFEPDSHNVRICRKNAKTAGLHEFELHQSGLSKAGGMTNFAVGNQQSSRIATPTEGGALLFEDLVDPGKATEQILLESIDDVVRDTEVGFTKLDVEGAEMDALYGSRKTLLRDKPFLAISIYHRVGDMMAVMDYVHEVVPDYRFWIRHYTPFPYETILYASI